MLIRLAAILLPTALWAQSPQNPPDLASRLQISTRSFKSCSNVSINWNCGSARHLASLPAKNRCGQPSQFHPRRLQERQRYLR
jgi:hypothetical protein